MGEGGLTGDELRSVELEKPPWGKRGYDERPVLDFFALAARRLDGRGQLSAEDVRSLRFNKPRFGKRGVDRRQVDALLDEIATSIGALEA